MRKLGLLLLFGFLSCSSFAENTGKTYTFGVLPQRSAVLTAKHWNPIFEYVKKKTGISLELSTARGAPEIDAATQKGEFDFVYSNLIFKQSQDKNAYKVILRPVEDNIEGQIVVLSSSPYKSLQDLQGREVGFPSPVAFAGYTLPMSELVKQNVHVSPVFAGNQEGIMGHLKAGTVAAAGVNSSVMKSFAEREGFSYRPLWTSKHYLNIPIAVHPRVPESDSRAVQAALDGMDDDPEGLRVLADAYSVIGKKPPYGYKKSTTLEYQDYFEVFSKLEKNGK